MTLTPIAVVCGSGESYAEAQKQAAYNALHYLKLMTKRTLAPSNLNEGLVNNDSPNEERAGIELWKKNVQKPFS